MAVDCVAECFRLGKENHAARQCLTRRALAGLTCRMPAGRQSRKPALSRRYLTAARWPSRGRSGAVVPGVVLQVLRVRTGLGDSGIRLPRSAPSKSNPRLRSQRCSAACPGPRGRAGLASLSMQLELPWGASRASCLPGPTWRGIRGWRRRRRPAGEGAPGDRRQGFPRSGRWEAVPPSARRSPGKALCSSGRGSPGWGT